MTIINLTTEETQKTIGTVIEDYNENEYQQLLSAFAKHFGLKQIDERMSCSRE